VLRGLEEIVWAVSPKNDTLDNLATYICQHAGEFFQDTGIQCHLEMPHSFPEYPLSTEVRHNLFLAVKEALTNILKHAQATEARIHMASIRRRVRSPCRITEGLYPAGLLRNAPPSLPRQPETETDCEHPPAIREVGGEFRLERAWHGAKLVFTIRMLRKGRLGTIILHHSTHERLSIPP
jgi:hypothetical protein